MDDPNLTTAVSSAGFLPTTSANYLVMPFTPTVPSVPMPQSMVWSPMQQAPLVVPVTPHVVSAPPRFNPRATRKNFRQPTPSEPPITVFVGNISEKAPDTMIRHILATCGNIASWKRVQGFGFCEYYGAEAALRAIKVLHDMEVGGKKLVVKVDAKAQETLDQFKAEKKGTDDSEENQQFEVYCRQRINSIITDHNDEMTKEGKQNEEEDKPSIVDGVGFDMVPNEDEKKNLIFREIGKFREVMKKREEEKEVERKKKQEKEKLNGRHATPDSPDSEENRRIRRREERDKREKEKEERDKRERERDERDKRDREKKERRDKEREREKKDREKSIDKENRKEKDPEKSRGHYDKNRLREKEIEEEELELKKDDDRRRERELAYQEKRKQWEIRENQKKKELSKERAKKQMIEEERERNAKKLKEFLEDYDDDKDDQKYYKGRDLQKRIELREKEIEEDGRDRQKEKDELEIIREKIYNNVDLKDPELEFAKVLKAREEMYKPKLLIDVAEKQKDKLKRYEMEIEKEIENQKNMEVEQERQRHVMEKALTPSPQQPATPPSVESQTPPPEFAPMTQPTTLMIKKRMDVKDVFNNDDEELPRPKKRKLVPLDYTDKKEEESKAVEEKKKSIRQLIERIPTDKDDLFSFHLDWTVVDNQLMEKRIRPWINKKIIEYIGEPEPTLVDFICSKVLAGSSPQAILDDVQMVLDEEAEVFVVKMWRLLVYEVEAKKLGLVKLEENGHKDP
ncbi:RNA-binding protein 25 [Acyrthosiphon pisum]|uniref:RNA-binding protein 25 n=1 Tax=Acyrthosiphon pisum TaxID=7029 RepID=A0A8R1W1C7_ACYPI|nr:RNA-binding protein 25 [Acyrthosiphon pisum]|eukprot:XP_001947291.1 PREDICTED: RNA-binding protein 25 [Acyrthosiphon pisum]